MTKPNEEQSNKELLDALGVEVVATKKRTFTAKEERIIAGFEEIQAFVEENERIPAHGEKNDIFQRLYAVRLDQIRANQESRDLVQDMDHQDLLTDVDQVAEPKVEDESDAELLAELGVELLAELGVEPPKEGDVTFLKHVKTRVEARAAEEIANRTKCEDFDEFKPIFENVQKDIKSGLRNTVPYKDFAKVDQGDLFILAGQIVYIADIGEEYLNKNRQKDARLRVIYDNGTESDILVRSLQRALNKDEAGRRITSNSR